MRKLSILALVVILASALSVVGYGVEDTNQATVNFKTNNTISLKVVGGGSVNFGTGLDPTKAHFEMKATTLEVTSTKNNWKVTHTVGGSAPSNVLSIRYGEYGASSNWDKNVKEYTGDRGTEQFDVSYKLDDLVGNLTQRNNQLTVTFTVSA